ncbi:UNVERIFIED_CONTAM: hypothetical protein NCL1_43441 [Trichonephila clavipes]
MHGEKDEKCWIIFYFYRIFEDMNSRQFTNVPLIWKPSKHDGKTVKKFQKIIEEKYLVKLEGSIFHRAAHFY